MDVREITVHEFIMGDVEDPELYAADPLLQWERSEEGQWVIQHAIEPPIWIREIEYAMYGHRFIIKAKLQGSALTEWFLRYGNKQ